MHTTKKWAIAGLLGSLVALAGCDGGENGGQQGGGGQQGNGMQQGGGATGGGMQQGGGSGGSGDSGREE